MRTSTPPPPAYLSTKVTISVVQYYSYMDAFHLTLIFYLLNVSAESDHESTESDEEFHMCQICNTEEVTSLP
jgi:hypothetical protein